MKAFSLAIQARRFDLAAHIIVLAAATAMRRNGDHGRKEAKKLLLKRSR